MIWLVFAALAAMYTVTIRMAVQAVYRMSKRDWPSHYDDTRYDDRDAPHGDDWLMAGLITLATPLSTLLLAGWLVHRRITGDPELRWKTDKARRVEFAQENERLRKIGQELEREIAQKLRMPGRTPTEGELAEYQAVWDRSRRAQTGGWGVE